jgi:mercuric ion binding protein
MKRLLTTFAIILVAGLATPIAYADENQTVQFTVEKMTCATCPIAVKKAMERVDGVTDVKVDLDSKTATVVFDASEADPKAIAAASTDVGFPATLKGDQQ